MVVTHCYTLHKIDSKWTKDINVKCKTIMCLEDLVFDYKLLDTTPKAPFINKKYFIKTKFFSVKDVVKREQRA